MGSRCQNLFPFWNLTEQHCARATNIIWTFVHRAGMSPMLRYFKHGGVGTALYYDGEFSVTVIGSDKQKIVNGMYSVVSGIKFDNYSSDHAEEILVLIPKGQDPETLSSADVIQLDKMDHGKAYRFHRRASAGKDKQLKLSCYRMPV
jgi:hypothetical protein